MGDLGRRISEVDLCMGWVWQLDVLVVTGIVKEKRGLREPLLK